MKKPLTAVLGCGPSGLLSAYALESHGVPFAIFSKKDKSIIGGAQFSHIGIPGIHDDLTPEVMLTYKVDGDPETYQDKVYGERDVEFVSHSKQKDGTQVPAWNLIKMYDKLWDLYEDRIINTELDATRVSNLAKGFELTISSVHATRICWGRFDPEVHHTFSSQTVRLYNEAIDPSLADNTIWYDGTMDHSWYRMSKIFGVGSTEWSIKAPLPPLEGKFKSVDKPLSTNCDCHQDRVLRVGRFGAWKKGLLTYHSYNAVVDHLVEMGMER